ncbi:hypothetical protein AB1Y20_003971 [Prymnesium parvum]|uniref:Protein kinase domain-containing protein n=1 Tax=Prymnesium parvum TaxID=97485 RepID=A0AB34J6G5_PRYPA
MPEASAAASFSARAGSTRRPPEAPPSTALGDRGPPPPPGAASLCAKLRLAQLASARRLVTSRRMFDCSSRSLDDGDCETLARELDGCASSKLHQLYLQHNQIGAVGIGSLLRLAQSSFRALRKLQLSANPLGDEGCGALARAVGEGGMSALEEIDACHCQIGDGGAAALGGALRRGVLLQLSSVWLEANHIGDEGCAALAHALFDEPGRGEGWAVPALCHVHLQMNAIGRAGIEALCALLDRTSRFETHAQLRVFDVHSQVKAHEMAVEREPRKQRLINTAEDNEAAARRAAEVERSAEEGTPQVPVPAQPTTEEEEEKAAVAEAIRKQLEEAATQRLLVGQTAAEVGGGTPSESEPTTTDGERGLAVVVSDQAPDRQQDAPTSDLLSKQSAPPPDAERAQAKPSPVNGAAPFGKKKKEKKPKLTPAEAEAAGRAAAKAKVEAAAQAEAERTASAVALKPASAPASPRKAAASHPMSTALTVNSGDVELGGSIAEGEFAEVFRGLLWGQKVAVKQLKSKDFSADALLNELRHEVSIMASLRHPNVLTLIGSLEEAAQPSIVLEVMLGTLYELSHALYAREDNNKVSQMLGYLADVASGCAYLHGRTPSVLHRDLKPPNVLFDENRRCKLCDFGTAVLVESDSPPCTDAIGSALYMAPEVEAATPYGLPADVFSFGAMAYEMFYILDNGEDFYEGMNLFTGLEVLRAPLSAQPQEWPDRPTSCSDDGVWSLLCECMTVDPERRPSFSQEPRAHMAGRPRGSKNAGKQRSQQPTITTSALPLLKKPHEHLGKQTFPSELPAPKDNGDALNAPEQQARGRANETPTAVNLVDASPAADNSQLHPDFPSFRVSNALVFNYFALNSDVLIQNGPHSGLFRAELQCTIKMEDGSVCGKKRQLTHKRGKAVSTTNLIGHLKECSVFCSAHKAALVSQREASSNFVMSNGELTQKYNFGEAFAHQLNLLYVRARGLSGSMMRCPEFQEYVRGYDARATFPCVATMHRLAEVVCALQKEDRIKRINTLRKVYNEQPCLGLQLDMWSDSHTHISFASAVSAPCAAPLLVERT